MCFCEAKSKRNEVERYVISIDTVCKIKASVAIRSNSKGMHFLHPFTVVTASKLATLAERTGFEPVIRNQALGKIGTTNHFSQFYGLFLFSFRKNQPQVGGLFFIFWGIFGVQSIPIV